MYELTQGDMIALVISLGSSLVLLLVMLYANIQLLKENRFIKARLKAWRQACQNHTEVPF
jgi:hypothetical protein